MTAVLEASGLGKRYGRKWALSECTLALPAGRVVGLVGPNGAGKTTLLHLSVGLLRPTAGSITVLGGRPGTAADQLARVGFVAARLAVENWIRPHLASPLYKSLSLLSTGFGNLSVSASTGSSSLTPPPVVISNDWVLSTAVLDKSGHALSAQRLLHSCPAYGQLRGALPTPAELHSIHDACINKLSAATFSTAVTYQPGGRFWPFQWAEMGIFLAAAPALCGLTHWWLRREYA